MCKKEKSNAKEKLQDPKIKAYIFFGFYFVFFLFLIILIRSNNASRKQNDVPNSSPDVTENEPSSTEEPTGSNTPISSIEKNYQYIYTVETENGTVTYMGKAYQNKEMFTYVHGMTDHYYRLNDYFFINTGNGYVPSDNPYLYFNYLDIDSVASLIRYKVETSKEGDTATYLIPVSDLLDIYYPDHLYNGFVVDEIEDDTFQVTKEGDHITKAVLSLDHFMSYLNMVQMDTTTHLTITLEFYDFGTITDSEI